METSRQLALVTGASSGLGLETASLLAASGFDVYGGARSFPEGVSAHDRGFKSLRLDVCSDESVASALKAIEADSGRGVSLLVNNAGRGLAGAAEDCSLEEAKALFDLNFFAVLRVSKAVLPGMRERRSGLIVNVGSLMARIPLPFQGLYAASKAAVEALSDSMASELRPFGIDLAIVSPGDFRSGFTGGRKRSAMLSEAYAPAFESFMEGVSRAELEGMGAVMVAKRVLAIARSRRRHFRYVAGTVSERLGANAKPLIPKKSFDRMIASHYKGQ